jgi:hypothetical protein
VLDLKGEPKMTGDTTITAADFVALLLFLLLVFAFWSPYLIAVHRNSDKSTAIALTLFFFGLTGIGWIIALIWALRLPKQPSNEVLQSHDVLAEPDEKSLTAKTQDVKRDKESATPASAGSQLLTPSKLHH